MQEGEEGDPVWSDHKWFAPKMVVLVLTLGVLVQVVSSQPEVDSVQPHCHAGYYFNATSSLCIPCPEGYFQSIAERAYKCAKCRTRCADGRATEIKQCSRTNDLICRCPDGYFTKDKYSQCQRHRKCPKNSGVRIQGNWTHDVVCEECGPVYGSNVLSSTEPCKLLDPNATIPPTLPPVPSTPSTLKAWLSGDATTVTPHHNNNNTSLWIVIGVLLVVLVVVVVLFVGYLCRRHLICLRDKPNQKGDGEMSAESEPLANKRNEDAQCAIGAPPPGQPEEAVPLTSIIGDADSQAAAAHTGGTESNIAGSPAASGGGRDGCAATPSMNHEKRDSAIPESSSDASLADHSVNTQKSSSPSKQEVNCPDILRRHLPMLQKNTDLETSTFITSLWSCDPQVLTDAQKEMVMRCHQNKGSESAVEMLVKFVGQKGKAGLEQLIRAYKEVSSTEVAECLQNELNSATEAKEGKEGVVK